MGNETGACTGSAIAQATNKPVNGIVFVEKIKNGYVVHPQYQGSSEKIACSDIEAVKNAIQEIFNS